MKRLMIVADNSFVVQAIRLALRQTAGFQVVGFIDGRRSVRDALIQLSPDVVLLDDMQDLENTLARLREVAAEVPNAKSLLLTLTMEDERLDQAFKAGAHAVVSKTVHPVALGTLLRETSMDNIVHRHQPRPTVVAAEQCPLTDRELEILGFVAEGYTNGRIASELWVTEQTVKFHLSNTYRKLGVGNRTEASHYAHTRGLLRSVDRIGPRPAPAALAA
jgi:DNA-binding NarL/FixJ family response regulator